MKMDLLKKKTGLLMENIKDGLRFDIELLDASMRRGRILTEKIK